MATTAKLERTPRRMTIAGDQVAEFALARHLTAEYYDCNAKLLADRAKVRSVMLQAAKVSGATVIDSRFHSFEPQGVSGVVIIAESHFSVHTWPEHDYAAVDLFTCGRTIDSASAIDSIKAGLGSGRAVVSADMYRGVPSNNGLERRVPTRGRSKQFVMSWKQRYDQSDAWGISTALDLYDCDPEIIRDAGKIRSFVYELCDRLDMRRYGDCQVVNFGEDERVTGFSMTQLIETSLISGHFANATNAAYLDIFSCKYYEPRLMAEFANGYFKGSTYRMQVTLRR